MDPLVWIVLGLLVGLLAGLVAPGRAGLAGDLLFGLLGAFVGGWVAALLWARAPLEGLAASGPAALGAAVLFVLTLRLAQRAPAA
jgi:uncharacterized membrane protein YeaQ/YmgE (transglycosylase-associated protein family)